MASNTPEEDGRSAPDQGIEATAPRSDGVLPKMIVRGTRQAQDTVAGCEASAASDLARSKLMDTRNGRLKLERSAANWLERSKLLARMLVSFNKRDALDQAESDRARDAQDAHITEEENKNVRI